MPLCEFQFFFFSCIKGYLHYKKSRVNDQLSELLNHLQVIMLQGIIMWKCVHVEMESGQRLNASY